MKNLKSEFGMQSFSSKIQAIANAMLIEAEATFALKIF